MYIKQIHVFMEESAQSEDPALDHELSQAIEKVLKRQGIRGEWTSCRIKEIDTENIGRCRECGCATSDYTKEGAVREVSNGAVVDGEWLCDICLPPEHPNAF